MASLRPGGALGLQGEGGSLGLGVQRSVARRPPPPPPRCATTFTAGGAAFYSPDRRRPPKGLVHFLGGAAVGAAPALSYDFLLRRLADAGYTVVATPYALTFRHADCAAAVYAAFGAALAAARAAPTTAWAAPPGAPAHGVGHSNGALLHLLAASLPAAAAGGGGGGGGGRLGSGLASLALVSYNNRAVGDAVPVPLDPLAAAVAAARGRAGGARRAAAAVGAAAAAAAGALPGGAGAALAAAAAPAVEQLGAVLDEVGDGAADFSPSPAECRALVAAGFSPPPRGTLLLRFASDGIDQTPELAALLRGRAGGGGGGVHEAVLPGGHAAPCGLAPPWRAGAAFSPADAAAQALAAAALRDAAGAADRLVAWLDRASA